MTTLAELQARMNGKNKEDARAAALDLANFYFIYNEEYNALQDKHVQAVVAYDDVTHNDTGVDQAEAMRLAAFILSLKARMAMLDMKMRAFHNSGAEIAPPTQADVDKVKELSAKVAAMAARDIALDGVIKALTDIAKIVNKSAP